jgi:membrane fusion protein, type I secretion system
MSATPSKSRTSIKRHLAAGLMAAGVLVVAIAGWARGTEIVGAVIASGFVVVESDVKKVQHPEGGIVGELNVHGGDRVEAGEVVVRLDATQTKADLGVITKSLDELYARRARLDAEKEGAKDIAFPQTLLSRARSEPEVRHLIDGERKLFRFRTEARDGQKAQLRERVSQLREEISGLSEQADAKAQEIDLIREELEGVLTLWEKRLVPFTRVTALKRDASRLEGERGQLIASRAAANGKISEVELQIIQVDDDARSEDAEELAEVRAKIAELSEKKIAAEDLLKRIDIRAPQTGIVHELTVHTVGGVVGAGETMMLVVPDDDSLTIEARVSPTDIDQLHYGQPALVRFSAFNQRTTPELNGTLDRIAADLTEDERTGERYYTVRVGLSDDEIRRLAALEIVPGMPVEVFVRTEGRTVLSYLLKPLSDQIMRAFRDG